MQITVELPNDLTQRPNPAREALEALAIAGFRADTLTAFQASQLLGFRSRFDFERFLKERGVEEHSYSVADLDEDLEALRKLETSSPEHG